MKTVAVVIAARQAVPWLRQCLESVAAQRLRPAWRLRICLGVDACEATYQLAKQLRISGLEVVYFPEHVGPFVIFNSLACSLNVDVLVRFDADDIMLRDYIGTQLDFFQSASQPLITQTWSRYVDQNLSPTLARLASGKSTSRDGVRRDASDGQFAMSHSVWRRLGSFRPWWCHADSEFLRRAEWADIPKIVIPSCLYLRRMHPASLTQSKTAGYVSGWRRYYALQVAAAVKRYSGGTSPECVHPTVARCMGTMFSRPQNY